MPPAAPPTGTADQALGALQAYQAGERSGGDILGIKQQQMGVPGAQQQVSGLRQAITNTTNLLNQVAPSVYGRTQGSLVTDAQATRQIGNEQAPLNTQLNKESQDYTGANADLTMLNSRADQAAQLDMQSQAQRESGLGRIYDALYGREKDSAAAKAAADSLALEQAKLNEQVRSNKAGEAISSRKTGASAADLKYANDLANQQKVQGAVSSMTQALSRATGRDGYVSPNDYNAAKRAWAGQGLDPNAFDQYLAGFRNPGNPYYGVTNKTSGLSSLIGAGLIGQ